MKTSPVKAPVPEEKAKQMRNRAKKRKRDSYLTRARSSNL